MKPLPFFSIIVPCFNQARYLPICIGSVQKQDFTDWELIIVNDGSLDDTQVVAQELAKEDGRIKVLTKTNGGLSSARNCGLAAATGNYLQFLDADDFILPGCFQHVYDLANSSTAELLRVGYSYCNESGNEIFHQVMATDIADSVEYVLKGNLGPCHAVFIKKELADVIGDFDVGLKSAEDWDFWMRAVKAGATIKNISNALVCYRYVRNSMSRDAFRMYEALKLVAGRGPKKDTRIRIDSPLNVDREMDVTSVIKGQLITCLGVSVMQGKIKESVEFLFKEINGQRITIAPTDYRAMYSYLSFRYWNSRQDLKFIFEDIYPKYQQFFKAVGLSVKQQAVALQVVFNPVKKIRNKERFGHVIGGLLNRIL